MKRLFIIFLGIMMVFSLAACGSEPANSGTLSTSEPQQDTTASTNQSSDPQQNDGTETPTETEVPTGLEAGKALVVYYSATGNTKAVAETIAEAAGADLFELVPTEPYTDEDLNWGDDDSRVSREHDDESLREVPLTQSTVENWDEYDVVFVGYPIWWGIAAWPMDTFIKANDFTGKTVIPFCTATSSGIGQSGELLAEMAGTGEWLEGIRFRERPDAADVTEWVEGLGVIH